MNQYNLYELYTFNRVSIRIPCVKFLPWMFFRFPKMTSPDGEISHDGTMIHMETKDLDFAANQAGIVSAESQRVADGIIDGGISSRLCYKVNLRIASRIEVV